MKKEIEIDENLIAFCGLYCGACPRYIKEKCKGCKNKEKSSWCKVKPCNIENGLKSCAECKQFGSVADCKMFNPFTIRLGEYISRTSRKAGIEMIKAKGYDYYKNYMAENKLVSIKT